MAKYIYSRYINSKFGCFCFDNTVFLIKLSIKPVYNSHQGSSSACNCMIPKELSETRHSVTRIGHFWQDRLEKREVQCLAARTSQSVPSDNRTHNLTMFQIRIRKLRRNRQFIQYLCFETAVNKSVINLVPHFFNDISLCPVVCQIRGCCRNMCVIQRPSG